MSDSIGSPMLWVGFTALVLTLLALDLTIFHRKPHAIGVKEAGAWVIGWVSIAALFNLGIYYWAGVDRGVDHDAARERLVGVEGDLEARAELVGDLVPVVLGGNRLRHAARRGTKVPLLASGRASHYRASR